MPLRASDSLLYTTVKLVTRKNGMATSSGTGFFWSLGLGNETSIIFIVTNKHVIAEATHIVATMHRGSAPGAEKPTGEFVEISVDLDPLRTVMHPDPGVDLAAVVVSDVFNFAQQKGTPLFWRNLMSGNVPTDWSEFGAIENVIMIGCPNGLYDTANAMPLVRSGITSTSVSKAYEGRDEFLVDMACFPGSSGSPVFILNEGSFASRDGGLMIGTRLYFMGVLYAGPLITNTGTIVLNRQPGVQVSSMMHLGQVIRSTQMATLESAMKERFPGPAA